MTQSAFHVWRNQPCNRLLDAVPAEGCRHLARHLRQSTLEVGQVLYDAESPSEYLHFPTSGIVSLSYEIEDGSSMQVAVVGNEGVVGLVALMGGDHSTCRAVVQSAGHTYRVHVDYLKTELDQGGRLARHLLRYLQALMTQISQTAVCNRHHEVEQRLCRWLLLNLDRSATRDLIATQEQIARNLGVRRESVTETAHQLQAERVIQYSRGVISVQDRREIEARVCECYWVVQHEYDRLLPSSENGSHWYLNARDVRHRLSGGELIAG